MRTVGILLALVLGATAALADDLSVVVINGRSMVPLRHVSETFGASISYDSRTKDISLGLDYQKVNMGVGRTEAYIGGRPVVMDCAPVVMAGVTYVPVRFISVAFGADCVYEPETRHVRIYHPRSHKRVVMVVKDYDHCRPHQTVVYKERPSRHDRYDRDDRKKDHDRKDRSRHDRKGKSDHKKRDRDDDRNGCKKR